MSHDKIHLGRDMSHDKIYPIVCEQCGSDNTQVSKNPLAWLGGLKEFGVPNVEIYCFGCTSSYCVSLDELDATRA